MVGVTIAIAANAVIPIALNLQKYAHERNKGADGKPLRPFVKIPVWWLGLFLMVTGEFFNLAAYGYAPTSLVAPVGAVGVFFNGIITTTCMGERFTRRDALGLSMIAGGVVLVVSGVPETQIDLTSELIWNKILPDPRAWGYFVFVFVFVVYWMFCVLPRYKKTHVLAYLVLCSLISSVTVVSSRAFSSIITNLVGTAVEGVPQWSDLKYPQVEKTKAPTQLRVLATRVECGHMRQVGSLKAPSEWRIVPLPKHLRAQNVSLPAEAA